MNETAPAAPPPNASTEQPSAARTHGAERFSDDAYWAGHTIGAVLLVVALALIVFGRGPRRREAMDEAAAEPAS